MVDDLPALPQYQGVMVSSTFTHVKDHRAALIKAIKGQGLTDVAALRRSIPSTEDW